jgi:Domain of unknown function (DUF3536)/Glycosyl hydrolase family 57
VAEPRYVCFHGHFYQPPRENPWTEEVELQDSARPYHDWNERITAECYAPNAAARVLDETGALSRVIRSYDRMSFDFGPTLLSWLAREAGDTYRAILDADRNGRGAMAQAYAHPILPLCTERDRETQVRWGLRDFELRFGRRADGMWLPETAVDLATLDTLARQGVRFTILAPSQAAAWRPLGSASWTPVDGASNLDTRRAYRVLLPAGRYIAVVFYDATLSADLAFGSLLTSGARLVDRVRAAFGEPIPEPRIVHAATDGETYGHHHAFGDMALAWAIDRLERDPTIRLTNHAAFLALHPPRHEVQIRERTAWSCAHGLGRWSDDCGCAIAPSSWYRQTWRRPLRAALDALALDLARCFESEGRRYLEDPWAARDDYVDVVFDRSDERERAWLGVHARRDLAPRERSAVKQLLEMQRHALLMFASCAWFFDEVSGIETVQALRHAARAAELGHALTGEPFPARLAEQLDHVPSNRARYGTARGVLASEVAPARVDAERHVVHHAARVLFDAPSDADAPAFRLSERERLRAEHGAARLVAGRVEVDAKLTGEVRRLAYAFLHAGGVDVAGAARPDTDDGASHRRRVESAIALLERGDVAGARAAILDGSTGNTLAELRPDTQRAIVRRVLETTIGEVEAAHERLYRERETTLALLHELSIPAPRILVAAAELVLDSRLRRALDVPLPDPPEVRALFDEIERSGAQIDTAAAARSAARALDRLIARVVRAPQDASHTQRLLAFLAALPSHGLRVDTSRAQVELYRLSEELRPLGSELPAGLRAAAVVLHVRLDAP